MLCATAWRGTPELVSSRFEEFRELCAAADDLPSLAIGMTGLVAEHMQFGRMREAMRLADEQMALVESLGDALLSVAAVFPTIAVKSHGGDTAGVLKWSQAVIDWAAGDPAKGSFAIGSPLAVALVVRGGVRWWLGEDGWREDLDDAAAIARTADPSTLGFVFPWCYGLGIFNGVLLADDAAIGDLEAALQIAEASGDDNVLGSIKYTLSTVLMQRAGAAGRRRALDLLTQVRGMILSQRFPASELPLVDLYIARDRVRTGDDDGGISEMARCVDAVFANGLCFYRTGATGLLVETLVDRGADDDIVRAEAAVDRLAVTWDDRKSLARDLMVLRLRVLIALARGDEAGHRDLRDRYRELAVSSGYEGHMKWAEAMP
jgi:type IV secretory pathway VirB2 component (pilin)